MNTDYIYERDFYCIDDFSLNEKWFEYFGYTYVEEKYRYVEYHIEARLSTVLAHEKGIKGWIDEQTEKTFGYVNEFRNSRHAKDFIDHFFYDEMSGEEKSLDDVNMNTLCGNYWSKL